MIEQLSVFLENEKGRLARMCRILGDGGFNMHALVVADTSEYGVVRVICDRPHAARAALQAHGFAGSLTPVLAIEVPDSPGGLAGMLELLDASAINVEYLYCFLHPGAATAVDIVRVTDPGAAADVLTREGFVVVDASGIYEPDPS
jgi:hypothetical protein